MGPDIDHGSDNLYHLQAGALEVVSTSTLLGGLLWSWYLIWPRSVDPRFWHLSLLASASLLFGSAAALWLKRYNQTFSSIILLFFIYMSLSIYGLSQQRPEVYYLFSIVVVFSGALIGPRSIIFVGFISIASVLWIHTIQHHLGIFSPTLVFPLFVIGSITYASWVGVGSLRVVMDWLQTSYEDALLIEQEVRTRRGELRRTVIALEEASARLEKTNRELAFAHQEAEAERSLKEQFVANVSHELRTPLNLVVGFAEMMYLSPENYDSVGWTAELVGDIGQLYRAGRHLQDLVGDILDLSRIDARRLPILRELTDLRHVIIDTLNTVRPLIEQKGLVCVVDLPDDLPSSFVDSLRIRQVLINLLNNAVRFTDEGSITVRLEQSDNELIATVEDTGLGIPEDQLARVFESFAQASGRPGRGGAGLGLSISRQLVEMHGGKLWVKSKEGLGSEFSFSLPLFHSASPSQGLRRIESRNSASEARGSLIVSDTDREIWDFFSRHLEGVPIIPVSDVGKLDSLIASEHPQAVLVNLPPHSSSSDWTSIQTDLARRYRVPVVHCSVPSLGWLSSSSLFDDSIAKPVSKQTLQQVLEAHFDKPARILVVDDNPGFVSLVNRMLEKSPVAKQVHSAYCAADALDLARTLHPDVILLDIALPDSSGFDVLEAIRKNDELSSVKVIAVTATSLPEELLHQYDGHWTLTLAGGVPARTVLELIKTTLECVRPNYFRESAASSAAVTSD